MDFPTEKDILCGRGGKVNRHSANKVYRRFIGTKKALYKGLKKIDERSLLVRSILKALEKEGFGFKKIDDSSKLWIEIHEDDAMAKINQALREPEKETASIFSAEAISERRPTRNNLLGFAGGQVEYIYGTMVSPAAVDVIPHVPSFHTNKSNLSDAGTTAARSLGCMVDSASLESTFCLQALPTNDMGSAKQETATLSCTCGGRSCMAVQGSHNKTHQSHCQMHKGQRNFVTPVIQSAHKPRINMTSAHLLSHCSEQQSSQMANAFFFPNTGATTVGAKTFKNSPLHHPVGINKWLVKDVTNRHVSVTGTASKFNPDVMATMGEGDMLMQPADAESSDFLIPLPLERCTTDFPSLTNDELSLVQHLVYGFKEDTTLP